jgi:hypothetical protein
MNRLIVSNMVNEYSCSNPKIQKVKSGTRNPKIRTQRLPGNANLPMAALVPRRSGEWRSRESLLCSLIPDVLRELLTAT